MTVSGKGGTYAGEDGLTYTGNWIGGQYIVKDLAMGGNGNVYLKYTGRTSRARLLALVE